MLIPRKMMWEYSLANAKCVANSSLVLAAYLCLPGLVSAQSSPDSCVSLRAVNGGVGDDSLNRGGIQDSARSHDSHDSKDQVATAGTEPDPATTRVICASLLPTANLSLRSPVSLTDTGSADLAAINEKWPQDKQQVAAMPPGREEIEPGPALKQNYDFRVSQMCDSGEISRRECRMHWGKAFLQTLEITVIDNAWNIGSDKWVRRTVFNESDFFGNWFQSVQNFRWDQWSNQDWWVAEYVGHPMQGAIYSYIWIQNDPWGKSLEFENTRRYWRSRVRTLPWSVFWIFEWRFGPLGEAALGNYGLSYFYDMQTGRYTWGTGVVTLITTPLGGLGEVIGEDAIDRYFIKKLENRYSNPFVLFGLSAFTPTRSMANLMRFRAPWYRDSRTVKAWMHSKNHASQTVQ